jgi:hypothetical protein
MAVVEVGLDFNLSQKLLFKFMLDYLLFGKLLYDTNKACSLLLRNKDISECSFA